MVIYKCKVDKTLTFGGFTMLTLEKMKEQVNKFQITFDEYSKEAFVTKGLGQTNWVKVSIERAIDWVNVGIEDIDCRDKQDMLDLLNSWIDKN